MGRGNERGGGRASSGGRGSRRQFKPAATTTPTVEKLSTAKPELKDHIFYVNKPDQAHNFVESRRKLLVYLGEALKDGGVMMKALEAEKDFEETKPLWCEKDAKGNPVKDADGKPKPKAVDKTTIEWYDYDKDATAWHQKRDKSV